jgi:uncharacterized membrane protein
MTKTEFQRALRAALSGLPEADVERAVEYYCEMIDDRMEDGVPEAEAVAAVGTVQEIAAQVLGEVSLPRLIKSKLKPRRTLSGWEITLLVLGFPLWFPLLIAAFAVLLSVYITIWAVIIALYATDLALACSALACVAACVAMLITGYGALALTSLGAACILAGLAIFMLLGCNLAAKGLIALSRLFGRGVKRALIGKGGSL